jgi:hypothetical protein
MRLEIKLDHHGGEDASCAYFVVSKGSNLILWGVKNICKIGDGAILDTSLHDPKQAMGASLV